MFNLLKTVNTRWRTATEPRQRSRNDFVLELGIYLSAIEEAGKAPGLKGVFAESTSAMASWKQLYLKYKQLCERADSLAVEQAALRGK